MRTDPRDRAPDDARLLPADDLDITVIMPEDPPELGPTASAVLLRIMCAAAQPRQITTPPALPAAEDIADGDQRVRKAA